MMAPQDAAINSRAMAVKTLIKAAASKEACLSVKFFPDPKLELFEVYLNYTSNL